MSIFRVEKSTNYTVISNYHLRDKNLSLRTIGLLSLILSLPERWDYSQAGLAAICKDGEDSIRSGLKELEKYGYLERERERDENGRMRGIIYHIYEIPKEKRGEAKPRIFGNHQSNCSKNIEQRESLKSDLPKRGKPRLDDPCMEQPAIDSPTMEFPIQVKKAQIIKDLEIKDIKNTDEINTELLCIHPSTNQSFKSSNMMTDEMIDDNERTVLELIIRENVGRDCVQFKCHQIENDFNQRKITIEEYDRLTLTYDLKKFDQVIDYMLDVLLSINDDPIKIGDELIDRDVVRGKLMKTQIRDLQRVVFELNTNPSIKNPKKYAISMLYNA